MHSLSLFCFAESTSQTENIVNESSEPKEENSDSKQTAKEKRSKRRNRVPKTKKGFRKNAAKKWPKKS